MRITVDVELQEGELSRGTYVQQALESLGGGKVETRLVTDKTALTNRINEAITNRKYEQITAELKERLVHPAIGPDCVDVMCSAALFSKGRVDKGGKVDPFIHVIQQLPDGHRDKVKEEVVQRAMTFLSSPRRLDCSRVALLPYAETIAFMVKTELLNVRNVVRTVVEMIRMDTTRSAGLTCLGKLVEIAYSSLRQCDSQTLESLRTAVAFAQQDDAFLYDVEYIMESLGWSQNKPALTKRHSGPHHVHPILALAYFGGGGSTSREAVVTSSKDGIIGTWDGLGVLTENIILSRHYASSLDLANRGHTLVVGTVGRKASTPPAVVLYSEEGNPKESRWEESGAVEPEHARFITCVRTMRAATTLCFCVGVTTNTSNVVQVYDRTQLVQEYHDHTDIVTAVHIPTDRENTLISGSRDCTVMLYDLRSRQSTASVSHHYSTISAISSCHDYIFTAGLDKRVVVEDVRMLGQQPLVRELDSAVLSMSVSSGMQCAVATLTGVYVINFVNNTSLPTTSRADCGQESPQYNAIAWNTAGNLLYAGGETMSLDILSRVHETDSFGAA